MRKLVCNNYKKYKAIYPPRCGCQACWDKWNAIARATARKLERIRK